MVPGHGCWTYANEGILLCLGLGLLLLDLLGVAALRVCIRLGFHFVICISARNPCFGEGRCRLFIPDNLFNFSRCRLRFGLLTVCGGFTSCISKQLIKSIHYFRRNSNHSGEDGIEITQSSFGNCVSCGFCCVCCAAFTMISVIRASILLYRHFISNASSAAVSIRNMAISSTDCATTLCLISSRSIITAGSTVLLLGCVLLCHVNAPTLPSAASACHSECRSEYRRHTEPLHGAVFLNLPRKRCKKSGIAPNGTIPDFCLFSANGVCKRSYIKGLQVSSRFVNAQKIAHISFIAACAAARRAMGTRNGEQET